MATEHEHTHKIFQETDPRLMSWWLIVLEAIKIQSKVLFPRSAGHISVGSPLGRLATRHARKAGHMI